MRLPKIIISFLALVLSINYFGIDQKVFAASSEGNAVGLDEAIKLDLKVTDQNYPQKLISVTLTINSSIDSSKVGVDWFFDENILKVVGEEKDIINLKANEPYVIVKQFEPKTKYTLFEDYKMNLAAQVMAAAYERNYINNVETSITLNKEFEVVPIIDSYSSNKNIYNILTIALYLVIAGMIIALSVLAIKRFLAYLESD